MANSELKHHFLQNRVRLPEITDADCVRGETVRLISTVPKSGTWSLRYFWAVLDGLLSGKDRYDPHRVLYQPDELACDVFGVQHSFCPGWQAHLPKDFVKFINDRVYPGTMGIDDFLHGFDTLGEKADPVAGKNAKIALVYRHPLDQVYSYFRNRWSVAFKEKVGMKVNRFPRPGYLQDKEGIFNIYDSPKETLRAGAANSYFAQLASFVKMQQIAPENVALVRYEDLTGDRQTSLESLAKHFEFYKDTAHFKSCFEAAVAATSRESMRTFEQGRGFNLANYRAPDRPTLDRHIKSGGDDHWSEVFDQEDVRYVDEVRRAFDIPESVLPYLTD